MGDDRARLQELRQILAVSQANNARNGITGYLIFDQAWFVQILEGEAVTVRATYNRIQTDPRHSELVLVSQRDARRRSFPQWSMGGSMRTLDQQEIFLRHGVGDHLDPAKLTAPSIVALAMDLQDHEIARAASARKSA